MMWTNAASVAETFCQLAPMATLILVSQALARQAQDRRARREATRIRAMLRLGLTALHELYEDNQALLASRERPLASGRQQIQIFRLQLGRLAVLEDEVQIAAVLSASFAIEAAETAMAMAGKPLSGVAFTLPEEGDDTEAVEPILRQACAALKAADRLLGSSASNGYTTCLAGLAARLRSADQRPPVSPLGAQDAAA